MSIIGTSRGVPTMTSMVATAPTMTSMVNTSAYGQPSAYGASMYMPTATMAAPMTTMAAPVTTMAAPVTTMAAPMTMMAAPQQMAAPVTMMAAPQQMVTTQAPSFVAAPATQGFPAFAVPAPVSLTQGLVTPDKLDAERVAYEKALDAQLKKQADTTLAEAEIQKKMIQQAADTEKAQFALQIDERTKMSQLQVDQQAAQQIMGLTEAAITQRTRQEEIAAIATADYQKKHAMEVMGQQAYACQKKWYDEEMNLTAQYQKVMQAGSKAINPHAFGR